MGLAICKKLVGLMNGQIGVKSEENIGSTFWFELELDKVEMPKEEIVSPIFSNKKIHILVAEDSIVNQKVISKMLEKLGHSFDLVTNGIEAFEMFKNNHYDLVLMDIRMPEMNGIDATIKIRNLKSTKHTPVIALTADATNQDYSKCMESGMDDYITKPIDFLKLKKVLEKWH